MTALLDNAGTIRASYYYNAFGSVLEHTGVDSSITYAGYQYDKETGLYYLNSRMYDPGIARFLQEDTYTGDPNDPLSLNLYAYCHNEPIMYTDPTGHADANSSTTIILDKDGDIQVVSPRQTVIIYKDDPLYKILLNGASIGLADDSKNKSSSSSSEKTKKDTKSTGTTKDTKSIGSTLYTTDIISSYNIDALRDYVVSIGPILTKATNDVSSAASSRDLESKTTFIGKVYAYNVNLGDSSNKAANAPKVITDIQGTGKGVEDKSPWTDNNPINEFIKWGIGKLLGTNSSFSFGGGASGGGGSGGSYGPSTSADTNSNADLTRQIQDAVTIAILISNSSLTEGTSKAAVEGAGNKLTTNEAQLKHMFRDAEGHFLQDNPANRAVIEKAAGSSKNLLGVDKYGNSWYAETLPNGTQAWAEIRNGVITEGGLNQVPKVFDPKTGLKANIAP